MQCFKYSFHIDLSAGKINLVKFLVTNHAELNLNHSDGKTPLHFAVENGIFVIILSNKMQSKH